MIARFALFIILYSGWDGTPVSINKQIVFPDQASCEKVAAGMNHAGLKIQAFCSEDVK